MDIYMAGSTFKELNAWLQKKGFNKLLSQENDRTTIKEWVDHKIANTECKSKLFIDSGAYTAHTKGISIDVDEYIQYLNDNDEGLTIFAQVDKIPGTFRKPKTDAEKAEAPRISWDNYLYMVDKLKSPDKLLPIFHQGEDFDWLRNMLEYKNKDGKHIPYIGISPANDVPVRSKKAWLRLVFDVITRSSNPNVKTHAFGMTSLNLLEAYPFTSADSTSWIMSAVTGSIFTKFGPICLSEQSSNRNDNFKNQPLVVQDAIKAYVISKGFSIEELANDYKQREYFNIIYLNDWADSYKYTGGNLKINRLLDI